MVAFAKTLSGPIPFGSAVAEAVKDDGEVTFGLLSSSRVCAEKQGEATFTGYIADSETGLLNARTRMYSPSLGRFVSRDTVGYVDGYQLYRAYFAPNGLDPYGTNDITKLENMVMKKVKEAAEKHTPDTTECGYATFYGFVRSASVEASGIGWRNYGNLLQKGLNDELKKKDLLKRFDATVEAETKCSKGYVCVYKSAIKVSANETVTMTVYIDDYTFEGDISGLSVTKNATSKYQIDATASVVVAGSGMKGTCCPETPVPPGSTK